MGQFTAESRRSMNIGQAQSGRIPVRESSTRRPTMFQISLAGASAIALLASAVASSASGAVTFSRDTVIASDSAVGTSFTGAPKATVKINVRSSGEVDLAWVGSTGPNNLKYSQVGTNGQLAVDGAGIGNGNSINGITYVRTSSNDSTPVVRVGARWGSAMTEYTQNGNGTFSGSGTGVAAKDGVTGGAEYDTDPTTGLGGFVYRDKTSSTPPATGPNLNYVHETAQGTWTTQLLESSQTTNNTVFSSFQYSPTGAAVTAYKMSDGTNSYLKAGIIGVSVTQADVDHANQGFPQAMTVGSDGKIYVVDSRYTGQTDLVSSSDGGQTWSGRSTITNSGHYGNTDGGYAVAVAPNGTLAALVLDSSDKLNLAMSTDHGATWDLQALPGGGPQDADDLGFDAQNHLYVAYYNSTDSKLHLLSTVPEPGSLSLLSMGGLLLLRRKRRA